MKVKRKDDPMGGRENVCAWREEDEVHEYVLYCVTLF